MRNDPRLPGINPENPADKANDRLDLRNLFKDAHKYADTDVERSSIHHTLGSSPTQAAPGNHSHTALDDLGVYKSADTSGAMIQSGFAWTSVTYRYTQIGKHVHVHNEFTVTATNGQNFQIKLPVQASNDQLAGQWWMVRQGVGYYGGEVMVIGAGAGQSYVQFYFGSSGGANLLRGGYPAGFANGDVMEWSAAYEAL